MLNPPLPPIPDVIQEPLYRAEATGLELSNDVVETTHFLQWWIATNYPMEQALYQ